MTTRKDADRPRVRCPECRWFDGSATVCEVARKVFVVRGTITCARFKPPRAPRVRPRKTSQTQTQGDTPPMKPEQDSTASAPLWTLPEFQARLLFEGLDDAVSELSVDASGRVAIRFRPGTDIDTMNAVGSLAVCGSF